MQDIDDMEISYGNNIIDSLENEKTLSITHTFRKHNPMAVDLLRGLLKFSPNKRLNITDALQHPYFSEFHCEQDEIECSTQIRIPIDDNVKHSLKIYRDAIY